tara:strand:- start:367 stop:951 length:585 start_codon:yes stop_codon:yes gene_type:complete
MQVEAIFSACATLINEGVRPNPEIMIPLVSTCAEFENQKKVIEKIANKLNRESNTKIKYKLGTMIELPRACLTADKIAEKADFLSFGTNDLTQTTFGFSRDDIGSFIQDYFDNQILQEDPFKTIDQEGVGQLVKMATEKAKKSKPKIKIGICGEHGGDPKSIYFFNTIGLDYVSCSPYRIPIAYLAAAKAAFRV